jgi:hypothetical protein
MGEDAVDVQLGAGKASMEVEDLQLLDFFNIPNGLFRFLNPVSAPASCFFDIRWSAPP